MARENERSLSDLQRGAERTRAEFSDTVDQLRSKVTDTVTDLRERVSPDAIKAEVSDYFRTRGELLLDKARENPLPAAVIGAGLAYPLFGLIRAIPGPVMMVGAGLYLLGTSSGQKVSRSFNATARDISERVSAGADAVMNSASDVHDMAAERVGPAGERVSSGIDGLKRQTLRASESVSRGVNQLGANAADFASAASDSVGNLRQRVTETVGAAADATRDGAASASSLARDVAGSAGDLGAETVRKARDQVIETSQRATTAFNEAIQQNPLLVGGIGLAVGMFIASVLPRSDIENGVMGDVSADVQKRANDIAARGFKAATGVATDMIGDVADQAEAQGLTPAALGATAADLGRRVRKVAENATTTAFELAQAKDAG
jgi:hypothetical protein